MGTVITFAKPHRQQTTSPAAPAAAPERTLIEKIEALGDVRPEALLTIEALADRQLWKYERHHDPASEPRLGDIVSKYAPANG